MLFSFCDVNLQWNEKLRCAKTQTLEVLLCVRCRALRASGSNAAVKMGIPPVPRPRSKIVLGILKALRISSVLGQSEKKTPEIAIYIIVQRDAPAAS